MTSGYTCGNRLIDALRDHERDDVTAKLEVVRLASGDTTSEPGRRCDFVVPPVNAVLSVIATLESGDSCEVGALGNEGAAGIEVALVALVVLYPQFASLVRAAESARVFFVEQSVVCSAFHSVEQRSALIPSRANAIASRFRCSTFAQRLATTRDHHIRLGSERSSTHARTRRSVSASKARATTLH